MLYDYAVIGKGLFGSAAAKYLSQHGSTIVIGPNEPEAIETHRGIFASHYDQGRLTREIAGDETWAELAKRSISIYKDLEKQSGINFYNPVGCTYIGKQEDLTPYKDVAKARAVPHDFFELAAGLQAKFPFFSSFEGFSAISEPAPAGYINPRELIAAQLEVAKQQGAEIVNETVLELAVQSAKVRISTGNENMFSAKRVLLATGAYMNAFSVLEEQVELRVKTETVLYAEVSEDEVKRLAGMPSTIFGTKIKYLDDFYLLPPIKYPDAKYYVKLGSNTAADTTLMTSRDMADWMRKGKSDLFKDNYIEVLSYMLPDLKVESYKTGRCLVTYTSHGKPYIDAIVPTKLYIATGGNGSGAKSSDAIGHLAAKLVQKNKWDDALDKDVFAVSLRK